MKLWGLLRPGFPKHRINLNNPTGKKKIQAILSKVTGPNNDTSKRILNKEIQADFVKNVTSLLLSTLEYLAAFLLKR